MGARTKQHSEAPGHWEKLRNTQGALSPGSEDEVPQASEGRENLIVFAGPLDQHLRAGKQLPGGSRGRRALAGVSSASAAQQLPTLIPVSFQARAQHSPRGAEPQVIGGWSICPQPKSKVEN